MSTKTTRFARTVAATAAVPLVLVGATACKSSDTSSPANGSGAGYSAVDNGSSSSSGNNGAADASGLPADPSSSAADAAPVSGVCPASNTVKFAKTKFVLHSGLAFGTFHKFLWQPYRSGAFQKGANGRIMAFVKGGAAALFVKREIRLAVADVKASPALCNALAKPLSAAGDKVQAAFDKLKHGDASGLSDVQGDVSQAEQLARGAGDPITEAATSSLSSVPN